MKRQVSIIATVLAFVCIGSPQPWAGDVNPVISNFTVGPVPFDPLDPCRRQWEYDVTDTENDLHVIYGFAFVYDTYADCDNYINYTVIGPTGLDSGTNVTYVCPSGVGSALVLTCISQRKNV